MKTYASVNYHKCCKYINMEIFIFKFPYIANYEIISVGLAVIFLFVICVADTILVRRGWGLGKQVPTSVICTSALECVRSFRLEVCTEVIEL